MDLNGDGNIDILSGSYSRMDKDMAGLFQVLWGTGDGSFEAPVVLKGSDGEPLIIEADRERVTDKICTRPTAVDLDGDGKLDIVSGNFSGTFALFAGEGEGRFAPQNTMLTAGGEPLRVQAHSDPFFVDWDADGDLDLLSGSGSGGVFLFTNQGSATEPEFGASTEIVAAVGRGGDDLKLGDAHLTGPQRSTRVWADDLDGDGRLDLLVGDSVSLNYAAEGLDETTVRTRIAAWEVRRAEIVEAFQQGQEGEPSEARMEKYQEDYGKLRKEREAIVRAENTGFVWLLRQK